MFAGYLYDLTESNFLPVLVLDCMFHSVGGLLICLIPLSQKLAARGTRKSRGPAGEAGERDPVKFELEADC